jgi:hypothetical protein
MAIGLLRRQRNARALRARLGFLAILIAAGLAAVPAQARFAQQGSKLFDFGAFGNAAQGSSVALSADGNTAIVGAPGDDSNKGAASVFVRSFGVWTPPGGKLVGTGATGPASQGASVAVSADGNTAIIGGPRDDSNVGATWVFTRDSTGAWTQQGNKLVGSDAVGTPFQGTAVALSADGNTAIVGGNGDNSSAGAAWVFSRDSNGVWTQQGGKLVGAGASANASQGSSVALSADGNTAIVGGPVDNLFQGAAWVFTRDGTGAWSQQGGKLTGSGAIGIPSQGIAVALSADGNTAIVGGSSDNSTLGALWVFTRDGAGAWTQQGNKLVGAGAVGNAQQGFSVALSADGNTGIVGGPRDNTFIGAAWVFRRSGAGVWTQFGQKLVGTGAAGNARQGTSVALSGDGSTALVGGVGDNLLAGAVWVFGQPAVSEVFPDAGTVDGGTNVLVLGNNLTGVTSVTFGGVPATDVFEVDPGAVFATTPPHAGGAVSVWVTTRTGRDRLRRGYTYQKQATVTSISSSANPSNLGQEVTFTATVTVDGGGAASGSVTFKDGSQTIGTVALNAGVATLATADLPAGRHRITAVFERNGMFERSANHLYQRIRN